MKWYPEILQKIALPLLERSLGLSFMSELRSWEKVERLESREVQDLQWNNLNRLLRHAMDTVPAYRTMPAGTTLHDFPIVDKISYREREDSWISSDFRKADLMIEMSSGSSGVQGKVYMSRAESISATAHQTYLWTWAGYRPGMPLLQLGMTLRRGWFKGAKDLLFRTTYTQAFNLDDKGVKQVLGGLRGKHGTMFFGGYASGLYEYARLARKMKIDDVRFTSVISWGDKMFDHYRNAIESQFQCKVFDTYGTTEGFVIAGQCEYGSFHVLTPHVYLELLDDEGNEVGVGEWGHVVVTRLDAYSMPLIRYRLGDLAVKEDPIKVCNCGRPFPMLKKIIGRDTDVVRSPSGKALIVHFFTGIMEHVSEIKQFQVLQEVPSHFKIRFISDLSDDAIEPVFRKLHDIMNERADEFLQVDFVRVETIAPSPSGKPQIVISRLVNDKWGVSKE